MADWEVASQTPSAQRTATAPPPTAPATGGWEVASQTPSAAAPPPSAAPQSHGLAAVADWMEGKGRPDTPSTIANDPIRLTAGGAMRSAQGGVGHLLSMMSKTNMPAAYSVAYKQDHPGATDDEAKQAYANDYRQTFGGKVAGHIQDAANWLKSGTTPEGFWENVGALGEQTLEFMGTDGLLKVAGGGAETLRGAEKATEGLKNAQQVAQTLSKNPKLAGLVTLGLKASKDAMMMGAQTYAHTEDVGQAETAAATGGILRAGGEATGAALTKAAQWARRVGPQVLDIAGEKVPALASQLNERGVPIETGAAAAPKIAEAQQMAGPKVVRNMAQSAAQTALDRINATRPVIAGTVELGEPMDFTVEDIHHPGGEAAPGTPGQKRIGKQPLLPGATEQVAEGAKPAAQGPKPFTTKDPTEAESWLRQMKDLQDSPVHDTFSESHQQQLQDRISSLEDQLGMYHAGGGRAPIDTAAAIGHVRDFGDASAQIKAAAKPVFSQFDSASSGALNEQFAKYNRALKNMESATGAGFDQAEQEMNEADEAIGNLMTKHAGNVSREEYQAARMAWRDASRLDQLHTVVRKMMNGVTAKEAAETGATQFMRRDVAHTRALENFLSKSQNRVQMEGLIGADGVQNLKNMTKLLSGPQLATAAKEASSNVWMELSKHAAIGTIGGAAFHFLGLPAAAGAGTAAVMTQGMRWVMREAATNPRVGDLLDYAVRNHVDPKIYAPLITRAIMVPQQEQKQPEEGQQ